MSIKDKLAALLRGQPSAKPPDKESAGTLEPESEQAPESSGPGVLNQSLLELSAEHQIYRLYNQRRQEAGYLPAPRLCLDEDGVLPPEMVHRELGRLRTVLTKACSARLKEAKGRSGGSRRRKPAKGEEPETAETAENEAPVLDALPLFFLSSDKLYAWVVVLPPIGGGKELSRDMLYEALITNEIGFGVDTRLADRIAHDERRYFNLYLIAKGKPAFDGKNGNIVDNFPRVIERVLEVDEFDQVDYTALNLIYNVEKGQEICHLIKPTEGEPGRTVLDQEIPAKSGKNVPLPQGRNTEISEDGTQLLASIDGSVEFTGRSFQVKPVLEISGNVDFSTGDLDFLGDINIGGNVLSGFTVRAMGNIHIAGVVEAGAKGFLNFLPAIIFIVGCFLAFATGTSWGTFGILIPIVVAVFQNSNPQLMIISISACMAGAVCGDHCSPISDTTIMASAGAQCEHVNHVMTQLPYAMTAAGVSFVTYIVAGFVQSAWIALPVGIGLMVVTLFVIKMTENRVSE